MTFCGIQFFLFMYSINISYIIYYYNNNLSINKNTLKSINVKYFNYFVIFINNFDISEHLFCKFIVFK